MKSIFRFGMNRVLNAAKVNSRRALAPGSTQNSGQAVLEASALRLIHPQTPKVKQ